MNNNLTNEEKKALLEERNKIIEEITNSIELQNQSPRKCLKCGNSSNFKNVQYGGRYFSGIGSKMHIMRICINCENRWTMRL
jgi:DNA-directed RNA polymerase subunit M/transcription elongation factor TFIIS